MYATDKEEVAGDRSDRGKITCLKHVGEGLDRSRGGLIETCFTYFIQNTYTQLRSKLIASIVNIAEAVAREM